MLGNGPAPLLLEGHFLRILEVRGNGPEHRPGKDLREQFLGLLLIQGRPLDRLQLGGDQLTAQAHLRAEHLVDGVHRSLPFDLQGLVEVAHKELVEELGQRSG